MITPETLRDCRSVLFVPGSNPRAIAKARGLAADMIVIDLEDAVKRDDKAAARAAAVAAVRQGFGDRPVAVRVNAAGSAWYGDDAVAVRGSGADCALLPKAERAQQLHDLALLTELPAMAMIETARGVLAAADIAQGAVALVAGTNDLGADLAIAPGSGRAGLAYGLQAIVIAARAAGIAVFDGVYNCLEDEAGLAHECAEGRSFGFDGKSLIHPGQIATANRVFGPDEAALDAAARLVEAATGGAERFDGRMIEDLDVAAARRLLARRGG